MTTYVRLWQELEQARGPHYRITTSVGPTRTDAEVLDFLPAPALFEALERKGIKIIDFTVEPMADLNKAGEEE